MEAATVQLPVAGSSTSELAPPITSTYDEDSRHSFAVKPAMSPPESTLKDATLKPFNTRIHDEAHEVEREAPRLRSSRMFTGKGKEAVLVEKKKPLRLLDLPVDILKDIVKEVTHTNDLTSLALCHSALHRLTIPHIYSRFDIVWPDSSTHAEPRSGVDALTYGLATLVMAEEIFGEAPNQRQQHQGNRFGGNGRASDMAIRRRRGNHYAQFTKKFSLGNGPADWVQEYLITKEGGKMLGTLVALAVARMRSLETFIWDMPTGILRDVWLALSSLGDREDQQTCRLEKLWVRFHDNSSTELSPTYVMPQPPIPGQPSHTPISTASLDRVEHPSFSVLPPLKSLSVLDIDELAYLDEMAVLIGKSLDKLRELRIGIARHAMTKDWVTVWEGDVVHQVDRDYPTSGAVTIGEKRLGGVLGTLTGFVCDMRKPRVVLPDRTKHRRVSIRSPVDAANANEEQVPQLQEPLPENAIPHVAESPESTLAFTSPTEPSSLFGFTLPENPITQEGAAAESSTNDHDATILSQEVPIHVAEEPTPFSPTSDTIPLELPSDEITPRLAHKLKLESLELERVPISVPVLQKGLDWTHLTSLTLLHCPNHEQLWKTLRKTFQPRPRSPVYPHARRSATTSPRKGSMKSLPNNPADLEYGLNLKKVHTNTVSPALISFLKETLKPNSLEVLFLQEARAFPSTVSVEAIYRGPIRRHRASLKKLLIDSSEKLADGSPSPASNNRWQRWMLTREILGFVTSGKMVALREFGAAMDYRDWHFFLQNLPRVKGLRSFYLTFLRDAVTGGDARELAQQVVDIVALRGDVELCYMGIGGKCFEILENRGREQERGEGLRDPNHVVGSEDEGEEEGEEDEIDEDDEGAEEEEGDEDDDEEAETTESEPEDDDVSMMSEDVDFEGRSGGRLRLREILFYDDKVAIFKARHGRL